MELNVQTWKEFNLLNLCKIDMGNKFDNDKMTHENPYINFVSRTGNNNGVSDVVDRIKGVEPYPANSISVALGGSIGSCFLQTKPFYTGQNISVLLFDDAVSNQVKLFITTMFMNECKYKYVAFGRELNVHIRNDFTFYLPIQYNYDGTPIIDEKKTYSNEGYIPDWEFMERYIKSLHYKRLKTKNAKTEISYIKTDDWKEFRFGNLISKIYKAKALNKEDLLISDERSNSIRYITRTSEDNGCEFRAVLNEISPSFIEEENAISIGDTTATCFYQSEKFITGDHMVVVRADWLNKINALFIVAILNKEQYKYSYGRAFLMDRIKDTIIKLPVKKDANGTVIIDNTHKYSEKGYIPDWEFMENYIKSLPYGDRI